MDGDSGAGLHGERILYTHEQSMQRECQLYLPAHVTDMSDTRYIPHDVREKSSCSAQSCFLVSAPTSAQMSSREVPDMSLSPEEGCGAVSLQHPLQENTLPPHHIPAHHIPTHHHPYLELQGQKEPFGETRNGYHTEEESSCQFLHEPTQLSRNQLYDFEDGLRHKINIQIEDFRMGLQHTIKDGFREYYHGGPLQQEGGGCRRCDHDRAVMSSLASSCLPQEGGVDRDGTLSSGAYSTEEDSSSLTMDQLIDQQLIQLQTCAALITTTLRRSEYHQEKL